ncbi:MAG TPA: glycosyltransferase family 1 protein, partial [Bacteroidota bacterium]|nr:glycosyltransferase family 1 protein [Bacteroidota bacterium]
IQNLAASFHDLGSSHAFTLLASGADAGRIGLPAGWRVSRVEYGKYSVGEFAFLGGRALGLGAELFHEPHYTLPIGLRGKSVVTVHDLIHLKLPQFFSVAQRTYAAGMLRHAIDNAGAIIAVSRRTKEDILDRFRVDESRISVVHNAVRSGFQRLADRTLVESFCRARSLSKPFILYVGNVKPHKNIGVLLEAFAQVRTSYRDLELVFAGGKCLEAGPMAARCNALGITDAVRDLGQLEEADLVAAYNAAEIAVLPSLYEGFGFPALEAMACGTAVIVSSGGALPEVVGDAAPIVDPHRPDQLAHAVVLLLQDRQTRDEWIRKGVRRAGEFSWQKTGRQTLDVYEQVLERCGKK